MIVLLDTNVVIDYLLQRNQYGYVSKIVDMAIQFKELECITTTTITDIHYIVRKNSQTDDGNRLTSYEVQDMLSELFSFIEIIDVTAEDVRNAISLRWKDLEDAVQYSAAIANGVDCVVTNNVKDFEKTDIPVFTPRQFLEYMDKSGKDAAV